MLIGFVALYLIVSVGIGLFAATRVHNSKDFAVAGRSLPLPVVTATVFATWFGAETVLGVSATFVREGMSGVVADPFGASLCLILAGLFFAPRLYRMGLLTIGDYYRVRYNRTVEVVTSIAIVISYLGWVAAQIKALGLVFNIVTAGAISNEWGMVLGAVIVLTYTTFGGMFAVAFLDFVQMLVVMCGLVFIAWFISGLTGGAGAVIANASEDKPIPVYGDGLYVRDWLFVRDHCEAILAVLEKGKSGEVYNIGGNNELANIVLVKRVLKELGKPESLITYVKDRPGHDRRYAIDASKIQFELGWSPRFTFDVALPLTIRWYQTQKEWLQRVRSGAYREYYARQYGS